MIRPALIALALCAPASAATVNDLTMTLIDGRPAFRPADGLDCYTAKLGGMVIDCALADAALMRPRRAPCWLRPDLRGPCPVSRQVMAALPAVQVAPLRLDAPHRQWTRTEQHAGGTLSNETPVVIVRHDPLPAVPLPGSGLMLAVALMVGLTMRKRRAMNG